jgi:uncharacterized protein (DUF2147 family)
MRKYLFVASLVLFALCLIPHRAFAQKDRVEGVWFVEDKTAKVEIYKATDNKFWGKVVWLKEPLRDGKPKTDNKNPNEKLRNTPIMGLPLLKGFVKDGENGYSSGKIYDPKNGKTYSCTMTLKDDNTLSLRGYIGVSLLGRSTVWTRAN